MSFRELRNLCEITRALGYPRLLSIENFRTPNFPLVAELLEWIVKRFEPNASLNATEIGSEQDRVLFIKQAVLLLLQNSRLKLNPRKLYQADGHAVQEILPAVKLLYDSSKQEPTEDQLNQWNSVRAKLAAKKQDVRVARQLSAQLPQTGAALHDLLSKEIYFRKQRNRATSRPVPLAEAEKSLQQTIGAIAEETTEMTNKLNNVANDEASLDEKIARKKREFEQMQKRFAKLQSFRPQYMDEYERYEEKLKTLYKEYVVKYRNLIYLQQLYKEMERADRQKQTDAERSMRQVVEKMRLEQTSGPPMDVMEEEEVPPINQDRRPSRRVFGNMTGAGISDEDDDEDDELDQDLGLNSDFSDGEKDMMMEEATDEKAEQSSGDDF